MTVTDAINQVKDAIQAQGQFNLGNVLDAVIGVASSNQADLQEMLNDLMKKKGILSEEDEKKLQELLAKKEAERKQRQKIRIRNTLVAVVALVAVVGIVYIGVRKKK